jgi:perosamine synthetase
VLSRKVIGGVVARSLSKLVITKARDIFGSDFIPLHRPVFEGNERQYLIECIDSNFVSSVGERVGEFENKVAEFCGVDHAVATVNGTAALHVAMEMVGVVADSEVITQALTFVATCNAISYLGAAPVFVDVDRDTMGMSPLALRAFLEEFAELTPDGAINRKSGRRISACIPMHTFGLPCRVDEISVICREWNIPLVEDAAESLGSYIGGKHTGSFATVSAISFNGNKILTTGGGGMLITGDTSIAGRAKHITTTAKVPHAFEFVHDSLAYNYRMPNLNAALGCAQIERLGDFLAAKKQVAREWRELFLKSDIKFFEPISGAVSNYWLNAIALPSLEERDSFLSETNDCGVMTRPIWRLMSELKMFEKCQTDGLANSLWLQDRVVNIPSSVPNGYLSKMEG